MPATLVGLTGAIGAGKSEALAAFGRAGAATLASDEIVHELLRSPELRDRFVARWGDRMAPDGDLDRGRIAELVFERPEELQWLEAELHPLVAERMAEWRARLPSGTELAVVEVPLLFETGMESAFDVTVCVVADDERRDVRVADRGQAATGARAGRQLTQEEKAARATHVISNEGTLAELDASIAALVGELTGSGDGG